MGSTTVVVTMQHPAHVHFFKHAIDVLVDRGHDVHVFVRDKSVTGRLLDAYGIDHSVLVTRTPSSLPAFAATQLIYEARLLRAVRGLDPDVLAAIGGTAAAHVAPLVGARSVVFTDTEHATLANRVTFPFADQVVTPDCFESDPGEHHFTYPGYHELAYLHPDRFVPDPTVPERAGVAPEERYAVVRLIAWNASHDTGEAGVEDAREVVERIEATGTTVLVTAEGAVPPALADRRVTVAPHRMHDLLAYADLFVGEGATMAAESAVLGTPAVYVNTLSMGYTTELEERFGLLFQFDGPDRHRTALETAVDLLDGEERDWDAHRCELLREKADTTRYVLAAIRGCA